MSVRSVQSKKQPSMLISFSIICRYLHFCEKMIMLLRKYSITPIIVIDGDSLAGKEKEDEKRKLY